MLYLSCSMLFSVNLALYGVSCAKDLGIRSEKCVQQILNTCISINSLTTKKQTTIFSSANFQKKC